MKSMALAEQTQFAFMQQGGLKDEGGTKDPVSGNDVPSGSLQEEVRDDIPAMLSEGEFVFPADVVRYYGLDTLMKMRQKAKQGLKVMEAMGQMGNSEEATIPDDIPFDMDDLELAEGGVVKAQQGIYMPPEVNPPSATVMPGFNRATAMTPLNVGTADDTGYVAPPIADTTPVNFEDLVGGEAGYDEIRKYVNDVGSILQIPFKGGKPMMPIPAGFKPADESAVDTRTPSVEYSTVQAPTTSEDSGSTTVPSAEVQRQIDDRNLNVETAVTREAETPRGARAFETDDFRAYLAQRSPAGSMGTDYARQGIVDQMGPFQNIITGSGGAGTTQFPLDQSSGFTGKAGDFVDRAAGKMLGPLARQSDRAIRREAARKLDKGLYASPDEYNVLRNVIDLEPQKPMLGSLFTDTDDDKDLIESAKKGKYDQAKADAHAAKKEEFERNLEEERAKNPSTSNVEMTRMMITNNPTRDMNIGMGETPFERETRERNEAEQMRQAAAMDAQRERENKRRAEASMNNDDNSSNDTGGSDFSEPTAGGDATHCCTASYKRKGMTISQVKELRRWHRKQSQIWQDGYDVWGKYIADTFVYKSDWSASVVKSVYDLIIKKKLTLKGLYGIMVISSGVYPIGLLKRIRKYGRIFQSA